MAELMFQRRLQQDGQDIGVRQRKAVLQDNRSASFIAGPAECRTAGTLQMKAGVPVIQGAFYEQVGGKLVWHGGEVQPDDSYEYTGKMKTRKKGRKYGVYQKKQVARAMSFEASGDGSHALRSVSALAGKIKEHESYDVQVGFYEPENDLMPGTAENVEQLLALQDSPEARGRLRVRVNYGRNATMSYSPTRYDRISVRNIMAGNEDGSSNTSFKKNNKLTRGVFDAQSRKLNPRGEMHFAASGRPYFRPDTDFSNETNIVDVDGIATENGLSRKREYSDDFPVMKNRGTERVGRKGTQTRVYSNVPTND